MGPRAAARGAVAAAIVLSLSAVAAACGGDEVTKADVAKRLRADPELRDWSPTQRQCLAELMVRRVGEGDLKEYVEGRKKLDDVGGDSKNVEAEMARCVQG